MRWPRFQALGSLAAAALVLVACAPGTSGERADAPVGPTAAPTAGPDLTMGTVTWTTAVAANGEPVETLDTMPRDTATIHAVVAVESVPAGEMLTARWSIDGVAIEAIGASVAIDEATASGWVSFALAWEGEALWPVGTLRVDISAESGVTTGGEIRIEST